MYRLVAVRVAAVSAVLVRVSIVRTGLRILLVRACAAGQLGRPPLEQLLMAGGVLAQWSTTAWGAVLQATCPLPQRRQALTLHASCMQGEMTLHCFSVSKILNKTVGRRPQSVAGAPEVVGQVYRCIYIASTALERLIFTLNIRLMAAVEVDAASGLKKVVLKGPQARGSLSDV